MYELRRMYEQYSAMPHGPARAAFIRDAVKRSDELQDHGWQLANRFNLSLEIKFHGDGGKVLPIIAEYISIFEQKYFHTDERPSSKRIDSYLYMHDMAISVWEDLPQLSRSQLDEFLKKFWAALLRYHYGKADYYHRQYFQLRKEGKFDEAEVMYQKWEADIATGFIQVTDCLGCRQYFRVQHALHQDNLEKALEKAQPILDGTLTCIQRPWKVLTLLLEYALRHGNRAGVQEYGVRLVDRMEWDDTADEMELMPYYAFYDLPRGFQALEKYFSDMLQSWGQLSLLDEYQFTWLLFIQAAETYETVSLSFPQTFPLYRPDGQYQPKELAEWFHQQSLHIAQRFDQRNGYPYYQNLLESTWTGMQKIVKTKVDCT